jgi:hypothetical protein
MCLGLARTVYIYTVYDRIFGDFPANNTIHTPAYTDIHMVLANPTHVTLNLFCFQGL